MRRILLTQGKFAIVDDADYEWLNQWTWRAQHRYHSNNVWYAVRQVRLSSLSNGNKRKFYAMHRIIMGLDGSKLTVDHIDGDGLNNQRVNLRICTLQQNLQNQRRAWNKTGSSYKGVFFIKRNYHGHYCKKEADRLKYRAIIWCGGKHITLGSYKTEIEAALAYDAAALKYFGEYARLNFPLEGGPVHTRGLP
jgi:hypothetical protein